VADLLCAVLIGRDAELGRLRAALSRARGGAGGVVFVTGEAGIGKSRLTRELAAAAGPGTAVLAGRAVPVSASIGYRPLTEALLQGLREQAFPGDADLAAWRPALRAVLPTLDGGAEGDGWIHGGAGGQHGDYSAAVRGEAVLQLLRRLAGPAGLLLVLEDLHWADPDTLAVLEYLSDNLAAEPVLCVATCRDEDEAGSAGAALAARLAGRRAAALLPLGRLNDSEVARMVRACLPGAGGEVISRVQQRAEGIPFLVEESLAASGVPGSFADGVRSRLAALSTGERLVLYTAALLGRQFDWRLLGAATGLDASLVAAALERGVAAQLLTVSGDAFRFRHMLTREAVAAAPLPPQRAALAGQALDAVQAAHPGLTGGYGDLAADLALQAGRRAEAGGLLAASGQAALRHGALATATRTLARAVDLLDDRDQRASAEMLLIESLTLAGQVDEAMRAGQRLTDRLPAGPASAPARLTVHLKLAHAAIGAARWADAQRQLGLATDLLAAHPDPGLSAEAGVLRAELALADNDPAHALELAVAALRSPAASPEVQCHALELAGRVQRGADLDRARQSFERALAIADTAGLAVRRLRALHELGTIDMFDRADSTRLAQARRTAQELGAASTGAVLDLQLAAAAIFRFRLADAEQYARSGLATASRLGLAKMRALLLLFLGEISALRLDRDAMDRFLAQASAGAPGDPEIEGSALAGACGMLALLSGDLAGALDGLGRGVALLDTLPQQGPAHYRGLWPLLLAARGDERAAAACGRAWRSGLSVNRVNRGLLEYADAILAGRAGDTARATALAAAADEALLPYPVWADLARLHAAGPALADGWGQPRRWLDAAARVFASHGIEPLERRCRQLLREPQPSRWSRLGITDRQADLLRLVAQGCSNKEIAARLHLSPRTVEKHVEGLLRETAARSRTQLVALAGPETAGGPP
jgi:DNA-binding CsgD family transcriptional regulator